MAQSVTFQRDFGFELFAAQIAEVAPLRVVTVHVSLKVAPAAACIVAHAANVRLQTWTHGHTNKNYCLKRSTTVQHSKKMTLFPLFLRDFVKEGKTIKRQTRKGSQICALTLMQLLPMRFA